MRILGLDIGTKTIGVAVSDEMGWTGQGVATVRRSTLERDLDEIKKCVEKYHVEKIVAGLPKNMDGSLGKAAEMVSQFVEQLKTALHLPVEMWDERLSTVAAERALLEADMSRAKRRKVIDKVAASIILQGYLDFISNKDSSGS